MNVIEAIVKGAIDILLLVLKYPLLWLFNLIDLPEVKIPSTQEAMEELILDINDINENNIGSLVVYLFIGVLIIIFLYVLYRTFKKVYYKASRSKIQEYTEVIEAIEVEEVKRNMLFSKLKKILRQKGTPREEVIYKYGELVHVAEKKELFKPSMTPRQLNHIIKIRVKSSKGIDYVTDTYNEAKFSNHPIEKKQEKLVAENINNLKKEIL